MKFILNGRSFDTTTSSEVAISRGAYTPEQWDGDYPGAAQVRYERILFRTAKSAFFVHDHETVKYPKGKPVVSDEARELSLEEAIKWIESQGAAVIDASGLPLPDEA